MQDDDTLLITALASLVISMFAAFTKNRSVVGWAVAGFVLPILGVLAVCALPPRTVDDLAM